jgi:pyruvate, water dikinase
MEFVLDLSNVTRDSLDTVGGKNANLGEMLRRGIRVPPGFAVTTAGYLDFLEKTAIKKELFTLLAGVDPADLGTLEQTSARVRQTILESPLPEAVAQSIGESYSRLCGMTGRQNLPVAVRSSATAEDLPTASFAGQQDTYLWVTGEAGLLEAVRRCWASLFTARAISYRAKHQFPHENVLISVGVQQMVNARAAGVMFTINPSNGDPSQVVIEGSWGLGETVVSGNVTPDHFRVDKVVREINFRKISCKHIECVPLGAGGGVEEIAVAQERQNIPCLDDSEIKELVQVARRIEEYCGCPQDIEWAIDRDLPFPDNIFIVQNRPETVWSRKASESRLAGKSSQELLLERAFKIIRLS